MANSKQAEKRIRQNEKRRMRNKMAKSKIRTVTKKFEVAVHKKNKEAATEAFSEMVKLMDTAAGKGIYHKNTVARKKSRMAKLLNSLA